MQPEVTSVFHPASTIQRVMGQFWIFLYTCPHEARMVCTGPRPVAMKVSTIDQKTCESLLVRYSWAGVVSLRYIADHSLAVLGPPCRIKRTYMHLSHVVDDIEWREYHVFAVQATWSVRQFTNFPPCYSIAVRSILSTPCPTSRSKNSVDHEVVNRARSFWGTKRCWPCDSIL